STTSTHAASSTTAPSETTPTQTTKTVTAPSTTNHVVLGASFAGKIEFGMVATGEARSHTIEIVNRSPGGASKTIRALEITGMNAADFAIVTNDCPEGTELAFDATCNVVVEFRPSTTGIRRASFDIRLET